MQHEMYEEAYRKLLRVLTSLSENSSTLRVELDELAHLTEICHSRLPTKFVDLIEAADKNPPTSTTNRRTLKKRLVACLDLNFKFPLQKPNDQSDTELLPTFSLERSDHKRLSKLCGDMRNIVFSSQFFDDPHKRRLLNRIAAIENEAMKEKGNLDTVLAGIVDVGDALGAFGRKVEPLTKRMQEVASIAKKGSKEYDQLPSPDEIKSLPAPEDGNDKED